MIATLSLLLLLFQLIILFFFLMVNGTYTLFTIISLLDIRGQLAIATQQHIRSLVSGVFYKPISIIVPAYNEEATIATSVAQLLELSYPEYEVVVVNDGSTDSTHERLARAFRLVRIERPIALRLGHEAINAIYISIDHPNLTVLVKENGGKADALNAGINVSRFPLFCCVDADSILENDALMRAAKLFVEDREVIATGGIVRVLNGCNVTNGTVTEIKAPRKEIECFQAVEYVRGFLTGRTSWNFVKSLLIISGAFGIFRKDLVQAIGGYRKTVGEDMDLVVRLHRHCCEEKIPYKILFVPDPVCWTQVPDDYHSLLKQRNRWHRGLIDSLRHNFVMFCNPRYGAVGLFAFPYFLFVEALGPLIEFLGYIGFIVFYLFGFIDREFALLFFIVAILWGMWLNVGAVLMDNLVYRRYQGVRDLLKLTLFGFFEYFGYRQFIVVERVIATLFFWRKGWGQQKRQEIRNEKTDHKR